MMLNGIQTWHNSDLYVTMKHHGLYLGQKNLGVVKNNGQVILEKIPFYDILAKASNHYI